MARILVVSNYRSLVSHRPEAEIFISLQNLGHKVTVMTFKGAIYIPKFHKAGIDIIPYHPQKKKDPKSRALIRKTLDEKKIDLLFLFNNKAISNGLAASAGWTGQVILYRGCPGNIHWYDPTAYLKHLHPRVDHIICNSDAVKAHLDKALLWRKSKNVVIRKGHDPNWYDNVLPKTRQDFGVNETDFILSFVGNDRRVKGIHYLLESTHYFEENMPIHLFLFGEGLKQKKYVDIAKKSRYMDRIHFMGHKKDVIQWVAGSDSLILSSVEHESLTKSVIEAMCVGTPVIITDIPGNKELLIHEESGLKVPPRNGKAIYLAAKRLMKENDLHKKLSSSGKRRIAEKLSHKETVKEYDSFIQRITSHN